MKDITVSVPDNEYPFFMKLVKNLDFVTIKEPTQKMPAKQGGITENTQKLTGQMPSPALEGKPMTTQEFNSWIEQAEAMPAITLQQAKTKWANKRKQLQQLIK
ncbi:MAG: hypothetical protein LH619_14290 [Chitinophagaceae bacterium]|nr:hypothetical protein [Chitinophagaceae bacterium]